MGSHKVFIELNFTFLPFCNVVIKLCVGPPTPGNL